MRARGFEFSGNILPLGTDGAVRVWEAPVAEYICIPTAKFLDPNSESRGTCGLAVIRYIDRMEQTKFRPCLTPTLPADYPTFLRSASTARPKRNSSPKQSA